METLYKPSGNYQVINEENLCIFVIEDDMLYRKSLEFILKKNTRNTVFTFASGEECFKYLRLYNPQVVLVDYKLNEKSPLAMNGISLLKRLKIFNPDIKVLMITSSEDINIATECFKLGAYDYIVKNQESFDKLNKLTQRIYKGLINLQKEAKHRNHIILLALIMIVTIGFSSLMQYTYPTYAPIALFISIVIISLYALWNREIISGYE